MVCEKIGNTRKNHAQLVKMWTELANFFMEYHFWVVKWLTHELCWNRLKSIWQFQEISWEYLQSVLNLNFQINIRILEKIVPFTMNLIASWCLETFWLEVILINLILFEHMQWTLQHLEDHRFQSASTFYMTSEWSKPFGRGSIYSTRYTHAGRKIGMT